MQLGRRLPAKLFKIREVYQDSLSVLEALLYNPVATRFSELQFICAWKDLANITEAVEATLQAEHPELGGPREKSWMRVQFNQAYFSQLELARHNGDSQSEVSSSSIEFDMATSVTIGAHELEWAANLLANIKRQSSEQSKSYQLTQDRVLMMFRAY